MRLLSSDRQQAGKEPFSERILDVCLTILAALYWAAIWIRDNMDQPRKRRYLERFKKDLSQEDVRLLRKGRIDPLAEK